MISVKGGFKHASEDKNSLTGKFIRVLAEEGSKFDNAHSGIPAMSSCLLFEVLDDQRDGANTNKILVRSSHT